MKQIIFFSLVLSFPVSAFSQVVNPTVISQDTDIALHHTDVYYCPMAPPATTDTAWELSAIARQMRDPDNIPQQYYPFTHGVQLNLYAPDTVGGVPDSIGNTITWMRLFNAMDKPGGAHSDILAGDTSGTDTVTVDSLEDVDFRATGTIRMEAGFHVKPGAYFHAYIAPQFDTLVFNDDFNDTGTFLSQWFIPDNAHGANTVLASQCSYDSNWAIVPDTDAEDGWALRLDIKENLDTCHCYQKGWGQVGCTQNTGSTPVIDSFQFSSVDLMSCPFPFWDSAGILKWAYSNAPYGKYEVREKIPRVIHHTNFWGDGQGSEWDASERPNANQNQIVSGYSHNFLYGPFKGRFGMLGSQQVFHSPQAHFANWNVPYYIVINNFDYQVQFHDPSLHDTLLEPTATTASEGGFPTSLVADSTDSVTFYYRKTDKPPNISDPLYWSIDSTGWYFTGPYGLDGHGGTLSFTKSYQPTSITFFDSTILQHVNLSCHWDHVTGKIIFDPTHASIGGLQGYGFTYSVDEGPDYPIPAFPVDTDYKYHTYTLEWFPHEAHFLVDGAVIRRYPDHLIPPGDQRYDYATTFPRAPVSIRPGEVDMDGGPTPPSDTGSYYTEKRYFEANVATCQGCWTDSNGQHIASHMLDYVKVWDLPVGYKLPSYPQ